MTGRLHHHLLAGLLAATVPTGAMADSIASCSVGASSVAFGNYNTVATPDTTSTGSVSVSCSLLGLLSLLVAYNITLSPGSGSYGQRLLTSGANPLQYNLYTNPAMTAVWGDGTAGTSAVGDGYLLGLGITTRNYTVYGKIPARQSNAVAGSYSDAIIVTIAY